MLPALQNLLDHPHHFFPGNYARAQPYLRPPVDNDLVGENKASYLW